MPLAGVVGAVASRGKQFGQQLGPGRPARAAAPLQARHTVSTNRLGVIAGEQRPAGWPAAGGVVALREPQPTMGQPIKVWRLDFTAVAAQIRKAHVVGEDHHDIRRICRHRVEGSRPDQTNGNRHNSRDTAKPTRHNPSCFNDFLPPPGGSECHFFVLFVVPPPKTTGQRSSTPGAKVIAAQSPQPAW